MKKFKIGLILLLLLLFFSINANAEIYFIVTQPTNLYDSPGENVIAEISPGYNFSQSYIIKQTGDYFKIEYNDQEGWILNKYLDFSQGKPEATKGDQENSSKNNTQNESQQSVEFEFRNISFQESGLSGWTKITGEIKANSGQHKTVACELSLFQGEKMVNSFYVYASNVGNSFVGFASELNIAINEFNRYKIRILDTF